MRLDTLGRRIGHNPWRQLITTSQRSAAHAWRVQAETVALGYDAELAEYRAQHPCPNLRDFMLGLSEGWKQQCQPN